MMMMRRQTRNDDDRKMTKPHERKVECDYSVIPEIWLHNMQLELLRGPFGCDVLPCQESRTRTAA
jgi:hypothetical protein